MPILDADALATDPEGVALLRSVLDTGRRGRLGKIDDMSALRALRVVAPTPLVTVEIEREDEKLCAVATMAAAE